MALLTAQDQLSVRSAISNAISAQRLQVSGLIKPDLDAAIASLDSFFDTNAAAINSAIPLPARTALTAAQKALLVVYVLSKRYGL